MQKEWKWLALGFVLLCAAIQIAFSPLSPDGDLLFHLKCGEVIATTHHWIPSELFTYTSQGLTDGSSASWLSQLILYGVYHLTGEIGLRFFYFGLTAALLFLVFRFVSKKTQSDFWACLAVTLSWILQSRLPGLGPLVFAQVLAAYLFFECFNEVTPKSITGIFAVGLLWLQVHLSSVFWLPAVLIWAGFNFPKNKRAVACIAGVAPLLVFLNPLGWKLYPYAFSLSQLGHQISVGEWVGLTPLKFLAGNPSYLRFGFEPQDLWTIFGLAALIWISVRQKITGFAVAASFVFLVLPLISMRYLTFSFLSVGFLISLLPQKIASRAGLPYLTLFLLLVFRAHGSYFALPPIDKLNDFITETDLSGNAFNFHGWGNELIFKHFPQIKVANDDRLLLHRAYFQNLSEISKKNPVGFRDRVLENLPANTDLLILSTQEEPLSKVLPDKWWIAYENPTVTLAILKNRPLEKIIAYYQAHGIHVSPKAPLLMESVYAQNPGWVESQIENDGLGRFPALGFLKARQNHKEWVLKSRGLPSTNAEISTSLYPPYSENYLGRFAVDIPLTKSVLFFIVSLGILWLVFKTSPTLDDLLKKP